LHGELQQNPSTQLPLVHSWHDPETLQSVARLHDDPCASWATQAPDALQ
jgi:hypothetical protein